jgi:hypothetical protein
MASRGWDFHLTLPQLKAVVSLPCAYCGREPSNIKRNSYVVQGILRRDVYPELIIHYSGLDRIDSSQGYIQGNVVPCCAGCNAMKSKLSLEDFLDSVGRICSHHPTLAGIYELANRVAHSAPTFLPGRMRDVGMPGPP